MTSTSQGPTGLDRPARPTLPSGCVLGAARDAAKPAATATPRPAAQPARARLLFLDDEERIVQALKAVFRGQYDVHIATSGSEALALMRQYRFHAVVSDQRMPEMSGVDFLRQAKTVSPRTIRLLLTGFADLSAIIGSVNDGEVYRYLQKPWRNRELQTLVQEAVEVALELDADAPEEKTAALQSPVAPPFPGPEGVLVLHAGDAALQDEIRFNLGKAFTCFGAGTTSECLQILNEREIGVLVANVASRSHETAVLLRLLKREHPQILTIALSDAGDAHQVIELINEAKVYRYLAAPYKPGQLRHFVESAVQQYCRQKAAPVLVRQQRAAPVPVPDTDLAQTMLARIRGLRRVFAFKTAAQAV